MYNDTYIPILRRTSGSTRDETVESMRTYRVKPEFEKLKKFRLPRSLIAIGCINSFIKITNLFVRPPKNVAVQKKYVTTRDHKLIHLTIYSPLSYHGDLPCLLYFPGGGFMMDANSAHKRASALIAEKVNCHVILVHYRLAPRHLFPTALFDAIDAFKWVYDKAEELCIDRTRIALGGDSSGGTIVAGATLMMRDQMGPKACLQILVYPALDKISANYSSRRKFDDAPVFNTKVFAFINKIVYKKGFFGLKNYAYPLMEQSYADLPPAYIETAEFDCLHDDGVRYASALKTSGVSVMLVETKGTFHGFDAVMNSPVTHKYMKQRIDALSLAFSKPSYYSENQY